MEFVRNVENRGAVGGETAQGREERFHLRGREDGGRLVHHEEARTLHEAAQNLQTLPLADRERAHRTRERDIESVLFREFAGVGGEVFLPRRESEAEVFESVHGLEENEVLEDHRDAGGARLLRRVEARGVSVPEDGAAVGGEASVEDLDERGFAGAVFAEEGVDFARREREGDVVVGDGAGEAFGDVPEFEERRGDAVGGRVMIGGHGLSMVDSGVFLCIFLVSNYKVP